MSAEDLQTMVTKVPLELLFTDFIDEDHKTVLIPHYTEAWYDVHKRYGDLPIIRLTPHLQLFRYLMNQGEYPKLCSGVRQVPARMSVRDYEYWKHTNAVNEVTEVFSRHLRTLIYTPILNPHFMHLKSERDDDYPTRMDLIMEYLGASSVRGKRVIDIGCNIGFYARHFTRQGAIVTGYEPLAEHYELARQLNVLERVHFDLKEEQFERSILTDTYDIGLLLTVFYHVMDDLPVREAFLRKLDQSVTGILFWESGAEAEKEKSILLVGTHFDRYEKLADTEGTGKKREFGVFLKSSYDSASSI